MEPSPERRLNGESLLRRLSVLQAFITPGGQLDPVGHGMYRVGSLVLQDSPALHLHADAVPAGDRDEVFPLAVKEFDRVRDWSRPVFAPVHTAPSDPALGSIFGAPLRVSILTTRAQYVAAGVVHQLSIDSGVLFEASSGAQVLIESRHEPVPDSIAPLSPLDLVLTFDSDLIAGRLLQGRLRDLHS